jgi:hypothetical protein
MSAGWLAEIPLRPLVEDGLEQRVVLAPGDRSHVAVGDVVEPGAQLLARLRDAHVEEVDVRAQDGEQLFPGGAFASVTPHRGRGEVRLEGELLAPVPNRARRWRLVTGEHRIPVAAVAGGTVTAVQPGSEIRIALDGRFVRGAFAAGQAARGRLALVTDASGELRPGGIDVSHAGSIVVAGSRMDAEALTRARAMGIRGIVIASLAGKELRDFQASERRQRAALHPAEPFGVLVLDGAVRRPLSSPMAALLAGLAGAEVAILVDPPALVFNLPDLALPVVPEDWVRVRGGRLAGAEGRVLGLSGVRRFPGGVHLEAARVEFGAAPATDVPLGDLERLG